MTDAGSIWESKLSSLQDPNLQKLKRLVTQILYDVEALPLWKRMWRRVFGG